MHKIYLNDNVIRNFRNTINDYIDFSLLKKYKNNDNAWNSICALMDRIEDIVIYLNEKELNTGKWNRCAFDFFEFIEQAGVLIECIDELYKIYDIKPSRTKTIFKHKEINEAYLSKLKEENKIAKVGDLNYFEYIRSLSSVHPGKTDRHKEFQFANFEVSPYVVWNGGIYALDPRCNGEIILVTYNNETDQMLINKSIYIKEIFNFIKYKYYSINNLTKYVKKYYLNEIKTLRDTPIRKRNDLKNNLEYLNNLVNESKKRCPNITDEIQEVIDIFNQQITREENINKYNKYCNALLYSMKGIHRQLQNMDFKCESPIDNLLFKLLVGEIHLKNNAKMNYSYPLQKILDLKLESGDKEFALIQYKTLLPFFNKYIKVTEEDLYQLSYEELYVLSQIAIYLHELEYNDIVNFCIPNDEEFR
ncbi:MAG: hypothetical protein ACI4U0_02385 [Candidatus Aphodocola sp.]